MRSCPPVHVRLWAARSQLALFSACMLLLSWFGGVPLPVVAAVFDMGKRGHKEACAWLHGAFSSQRRALSADRRGPRIVRRVSWPGSACARTGPIYGDEVLVQLCELDALRTRTSCAQVKRHPYTRTDVRTRTHAQTYAHARMDTFFELAALRTHTGCAQVRRKMRARTPEWIRAHASSCL